MQFNQGGLTMDDTRGNFQPIEEQQAMTVQEAGERGIFRVGQQVTIGESFFRVRKITRKDLILRLLPRGGRDLSEVR